MSMYHNVNGSWETVTPQFNTGGPWTSAKAYHKVNGEWLIVSGETIDNFEDGNRSGWTVPASTGDDQIVSPGLNGSDFLWEHTGFREGHLRGADAVDRGPQPGDVFEFWFRITSTSSGQVRGRFEFSADGTNDGDKYRIEWERQTQDNELSIAKWRGGSQVLLDTDEAFAAAVGQIYRCEVQWNHGDNQIIAQLFGPSGSALSNQVSITDDSVTSGGEFTQPGIVLWTNANQVCEYDEIGIIDS